MFFFWFAFAFLLGSFPFSFWLGRLAAQTDVRRVGDGNPGAANAWKVGGWRIGVPALLLDFFKGAIPVGLAHYRGGLSATSLAAVALAPMLGHAFSPFLRFRGGKALAVTFGVWTGLTLAEGPLVLGLFFALFLWLLSSNAWAATLGMLAFGAYWVLRQPAPYLFSVWAGNTLILLWKHRQELRQGITLRKWLANFLGGWRRGR